MYVPVSCLSLHWYNAVDWVSARHPTYNNATLAVSIGFLQNLENDHEHGLKTGLKTEKCGPVLSLNLELLGVDLGLCSQILGLLLVFHSWHGKYRTWLKDVSICLLITYFL